MVLLPLEAWPLLLRVNAAVHRHVPGARVSGVVDNLAFTRTYNFFSQPIRRLCFVCLCDCCSRILCLVHPPSTRVPRPLWHVAPLIIAAQSAFARCVYSLHASLIGEAGTEAGSAPRLQFPTASHYSRCNLPSFQRWIFSGGRLRAHPAVPEQPSGFARLGYRCATCVVTEE